MYRKVIPFNKNDLPEVFLIDLDNTTYQLTVSYNHINDSYYLTIADEDGEEMVTNERLLLNETLFADITFEELPVTALVPLDETNQATSIGYAEMNELVFISIDDLFPGELDPDNTNSGLLNPDGDDANESEDNIEDEDEDENEDGDDDVFSSTIS